MVKRCFALFLFIVLCVVSPAQTVTQFHVANTVKNPKARPGGVNTDSWNSYGSIYGKNTLATNGNVGFQPFYARQIFAVASGTNLLSLFQVQSNVSNLQYDGVPLNFWPNHSGTMIVGYSASGDTGFTSAISANTQAPASIAADVTGMSLSAGNITLTFTKTAGTTPTVGKVFPYYLSGVTGGTGTINRIVTATVLSATSISYAAAGEDPTGANLSSAKLSSGQGAMFTLASARPHTFAVGDIFTVQFNSNPQSGNGNGWTCTASNGAICATETTDTCTASQTIDQITGGQGPGCGGQSLKCDTSMGGGASCQIRYVLDNATGEQNFKLMHGVYKTAFMGKLVSGTPTASVNVQRAKSGTPVNYSYAPTLTSSWAQYSNSVSLNETDTTTNLGQLWVTWTLSGVGVQLIDNVGFYDVGTDSTNQSIFTDDFVAQLRLRHPGTLRMWAGGLTNGTTLENMLLPLETMTPGASGLNNVYNVANGGNGGGGTMFSIPAFLKLCQTVMNGTYVIIPHFVVPATAGTTEWAHLSEYLYGAAGTTYGDLRIAQGGPSAVGGWATIFTDGIVPEAGNENWNQTADGLGFRSASSYIYADYGVWQKMNFAAFRADPSYTSCSACRAVTILTVGVQTALNAVYSTQLVSDTKADGVAFAGYYGNGINTTYPDKQFYGPVMTELYLNTHGTTSGSGFAQQLIAIKAYNQCGATQDQPCKMVIYEQAPGTGNAGCNQTCLANFVSGRVTAFTAWSQNLWNIDAGVTTQTDFSAIQYSFTENGLNFPGWGEYTDFGGQMSAKNAAIFGGHASLRPNAVGAELAANCVIGPQLVVTDTNQTYYDFVDSSYTATVTALSGSGTITATLNVTVGTLPPVGTITNIKIAGVVGGTGTLNGTFNSSTVTGANTVQYVSAGADATGATLTTATSTDNGNGVTAITNVPYLQAFAFQQAGKTCFTVGNADPVNSHQFSVDGVAAPTGTVARVELNTGSLGDTNEAYNLSYTGNYAATVFSIADTISGFSSSNVITLAPGQIISITSGATGSAVTRNTTLGVNVFFGINSLN